MSIEVITTDGPAEIMDNGVIVVSDENTARSYLSKHGWLVTLETQPKGNFITGTFESETAYVMATLDRGHANGDNVVTVALFPKKIFTLEQFIRFVAQAAIAHAPDARPYVMTPANN